MKFMNRIQHVDLKRLGVIKSTTAQVFLLKQHPQNPNP